MPVDIPPVQPASERHEDPPRLRRAASEELQVTSRDPGPDPVPVGVEVRTHTVPDSLRLVTDIVDASTRAVLYRIPPQAVTDAVVRQSELISRYERLMASAAEPARRRAGI